MIFVKGLSKQFGAVRAVENLSFRIRKGEIVGFLGPNAAGKTTTMRLITGYLAPDAGSITLGGFDSTYQPLEVKRRIGYLPENLPLYIDMRVEAYLRFVAALKGVKKLQIDTEIQRVSDRLSIVPVLDDYITTLSRGYKQRVGLAQALIGNPPVLILDEPTVGLDPRQIVEVRELIRSLAPEHTIILSTHILPEVSMTCDRVIIINKGHLIAEDTPEELAASLKRKETICLEIAGEKQKILNIIRKSPGVHAVSGDATSQAGVYKFVVECEPDPDIQQNLAKIVVENGWGLLEMRTERPRLEDIFLQLTTREEGVN